MPPVNDVTNEDAIKTSVPMVAFILFIIIVIFGGLGIIWYMIKRFYPTISNTHGPPFSNPPYQSSSSSLTKDLRVIDPERKQENYVTMSSKYYTVPYATYYSKIISATPAPVHA